MSTSPEFLCALCNKSLDLTTDVNTDEAGKAVHEDCYVRKITGRD
jgi:hypothetical protein